MEKHLKIFFRLHFIWVFFLISSATYAIEKDLTKKEEFAEEKEMIKEQLSLSPVRFLENMGQMTDTDHKPIPFVLFKASAPGMDVYLTEKGLSYVFVKVEEEPEKEISHASRAKKEEKKIEMNWINLHLSGASIKKENIIKTGESVHHFNYFYGHCPDGIYGVKEYERITIKDVYPGIDWVLYGSSNRGMKYDFIVHPGADPSLVKLVYESEKPMSMDLEGNLHFQTLLGKLTEEAPYCYIQETQAEIPSIYNLKKIDGHQTEVTFELSSIADGAEAENLKRQTLIIDPQLVWATVYGGSGADGIVSIDSDIEGNIYATGYLLESYFFPTQEWGTYNQNNYGGGGSDCFILMFTNTGVLTWATHYGGLSLDNGKSIACDGRGNIYITGYTNSSDFPSMFRDGAYNQNNNSFNANAFILRFTNAGLLTWGTLYGGDSGWDEGLSVICDRSGNVYVTGVTNSPDLPTKLSDEAYNKGYNGDEDIFIVKFTIDGALFWATYYGGNSSDRPQSIALDNLGNLYITGSTMSSNFPIQSRVGAFNKSSLNGSVDAFILRFDFLGALTWSTYYGGDQFEYGCSIGCDRSGNVYVTGENTMGDFPTKFWPGAYNQNVYGGGVSDCFIIRFTNTGALSWATYYGGNNAERVNFDNDNLEIDNCGNVYISFSTASTNLYTLKSTCEDYNDTTFGGQYDIFLIKFSNTGAVLWTTYLGGNGYDFRSALTLDNNDNLFVAGEWWAYYLLYPAIPTTYPFIDLGSGAYYDSLPNGSDDCYITKFISIFTQQFQVNSTNCLCNGSARVDVEACGTVTFLWNTGATTNNITDLCPGLYNVIIQSDCRIDTLYFTILGSITPPSLTVNTISPFCNGDSNGSATVNATGGTPPYTYLWETGGTDTTENNLTASTYTVWVTDSSSCRDSIDAIVTEPMVLSVLVNNVKDVCNGIDDGSIDIGILGGTPGYSYAWSNGAMTEDADSLSAGAYTCVVTDTNGCKDSTTATVIAPPALIVAIDSVIHIHCGGGNEGAVNISVSGGTPGYSYAWSNGIFTEDISNLTAGNYSITVTDEKGCTITTDTTLAEPPVISVSFDAIDLLCNNDSNGTAIAKVTGGIPPYDFWWSSLGSSNDTVKGLQGGSYEVLVKDSINCEQRASVNINEPAPLVVTVSEDVSFCEGDSVTIDATVRGGTKPYTYNWNLGGSDSSLTVSPSQTTTYIVSVTDANNCNSLPQAVTVTFNALPVVSFTADPQNGCAPLCVSFSNTTPNTADADWSFGNGNGGNVSEITHCYPAPGIYSVGLTVIDNNGCSNSLSIPDLIKVFPNPVADFTMTPPQYQTISGPVLFNDQSTGAAHWFWNFGDILNTFSALRSPVFVYNESGSYTVSLIVTNNEGCTDTASHTIIIEPVFSIYIPNAFTPDGDGINDSFSPKGAEFTEYEMSIFNRWGEKVYQTHNVDKPWDGKSGSGSATQEGVYAYKIRVIDFKGINHYYVGNVTLIR